MNRIFLMCAAAGLVCTTVPQAHAQDDVADVPCVDTHVADNAQQRYFLIGAKEGAAAPAGGYKLLIVMPGGDGGADFNPFVRRIWKNALPAGYLIAQPVAVKWTPEQGVVWPTKKAEAKDMRFTTLEFVDAVIKDVQSRHKVNPKRVFTLSWSSSGPAAYAISLRRNSPVTGSYVSMSVFKPDQLPALTVAKGHAYYIEHGKGDKVCPFRMAEEARNKLRKAGATVKFSADEGGHGWNGDVYGKIRAGVEWLEKNAAKPATRESAKTKGSDGKGGGKNDDVKKSNSKTDEDDKSK